MCGIAGIFNTDGRSVSITQLKKMTDIIAHRGPDGEGFWMDSFIGFGHRRLAIIDLSPLGHQPMQTDDGNLIITYNGEVYNFQNLRVELESKGYIFHSKTDSEVILKSYQEWGEKCLDKFNGMFAFAIWDKTKNTLFAARDRYGIKPFYYFFDGRTFIFGSEIKAILENNIYKPMVCLDALNEYFSFQNIFSDRTLFKDIKILLPGNKLKLSLGDSSSISIEQYWDYNFVDDNSLDEEEYTKEVRNKFEMAVNRQLISDVEVGSYLSGGMDSGSITSIAASNFKNLKTFTCGFDLSSASGLELAFDERAKSEFLSNIYKTEHYEVVLKAGDMERIMPELIWHLEDLRVGQSYPNYYVSRLASKFVKVVMSGAGGDELFAGYPWRYFRAVINEDSSDYAKKYYEYWQRLIADTEKEKFFTKDVLDRIDLADPESQFMNVLNIKKTSKTNEEYINKSLYFEIKTFLHGLLIVEDKLSSAHSLETRVPFLDNELVDLAMRIPISMKLKFSEQLEKLNENDTQKFIIQSNAGKLILRNSLVDLVPESYVNGTKQGFSAPDASWFKGESIEYIKKLLSSKNANIFEYIEFDYIQKILEEHFTGSVNHRLVIWSLLCFEWWLKVFIRKTDES